MCQQGDKAHAQENTIKPCADVGLVVPVSVPLDADSSDSSQGFPVSRQQDVVKLSFKSSCSAKLPHPERSPFTTLPNSQNAHLQYTQSHCNQQRTHHQITLQTTPLMSLHTVCVCGGGSGLLSVACTLGVIPYMISWAHSHAVLPNMIMKRDYGSQTTYK